MDTLELDQKAPATLNDLLVALQNINHAINANNHNTLDYQVWTVSDIATWLKLSDSYIRQKVIYSSDFPPPLDRTKTKALKLRWMASDVVAWAKRNSYNLPNPKKRGLR